MGAATARCVHLAHLVRRRARPARTMEIVATVMSARSCLAATARFADLPHIFVRRVASPARTTEIVATVTARTSSAATARCAHLAHLVRRRASPAKTMEIVATMMSAGTCTAAAARFAHLPQPQLVWPLVRFALRRALAVKSSNAVEGALAINCTLAMATLAPPEGLEPPSRPCDRLEEA